MQYYEINKEYITATLCLNKDKPEMECNGSCYLKDQLKLQDDTERKIPGVLKEKAETVFFLLSASSDFAEYIWAKDRVVYKPYLFPVLSANQYAVFHPPETV